MRSTRSRLLVAVAASGLLAGCRHDPPLPLIPEETASRYLDRTLEDPSLRDYLERELGEHIEEWPRTHWSLRDLTLAAFFLQSDLRVARATAAVAGAHVGAAGARPNPTLSFLPQRVANPESGVSPWLAAVSLDWPIETAGKRGHRRAAAEARADAAALAVRGAAWQVRGNVYEAVVTLRAAQARHAALDRTVALRDRQLSLLEARRAAGEIAEAVVATERHAQMQASADLAAAERQRVEALGRLAAAVGAPRAAFDGVAVDYPLDAPPEGEGTPGCDDARRAALLGRSDVLALLAEYAAAEEDLRLELAKQYPDLHLGPGYEFDQGADKWGLGVSVELPVVDQNAGAIDEALARRGEVAARFEALQAQVIDDVDAACAALAGARREQEDARSLHGQARDRLALAQSRFDLGALDRVGILAAELEVQLAVGVLIDSEERLHLAQARLERATERPHGLPEASIRGASDPRAAGEAG